MAKENNKKRQGEEWTVTVRVVANRCYPWQQIICSGTHTRTVCSVVRMCSLPKGRARILVAAAEALGVVIPPPDRLLFLSWVCSRACWTSLEDDEAADDNAAADADRALLAVAVCLLLLWWDRLVEVALLRILLLLLVAGTVVRGEI